MAADIATTIGTDLAIKGYDTARAAKFAKRFLAPHLAAPLMAGHRHGRQA
jgi:hypothetical protein